MTNRPTRKTTKKGRTYVGWVGFTNGALNWFRDEHYYNGVLQADVFRKKSDARKCYQDVRRVTIIVEE